MSILLDDVKKQFLELDTPVEGFPPYAVSFWVYLDDLTPDQTLFSVADKDSLDQYVAVRVVGGVPQLKVKSGGTEGIAIASGSMTVNTWHHIYIDSSDTSNRRILLDNANEGTDTTTVNPTGLDRTALGRLGHQSPLEYMSGRVAEVAVWSAPLDDKDLPQLLLGISPLKVRPELALVYWPLLEVPTGNGAELVSDWTTYTPSNDWTNQTSEGWWRQVGDSLDLRFRVSFTGVPVAGSSGMLLGVPSGFTIDVSKFPFATTTRNGVGSIRDVSGPPVTATELIARINSTGNGIDFHAKVAGATYVTLGSPFSVSAPYVLASGDVFIAEVFGVPVL